MKTFGWCAYDSEFTPNTSDRRFKSWIKQGLTTYISFIKENSIQSFKALQDKHGLEQNKFYGYLQVRHYINQECKFKDF